MNSKPKQKTWNIVRPPLSPYFDMPTKKELMDVFQGDSVKLIFSDDNNFNERMWVSVRECGNMEHWVGYLDNDPLGDYSNPRLKAGSTVEFHPYDVIDIISEREFDNSAELKPEKFSFDNPVNKIERSWYRDPKYLVPIVIGLVGSATTIVAALL